MVMRFQRDANARPWQHLVSSSGAPASICHTNRRMLSWHSPSPHAMGIYGNEILLGSASPFGNIENKENVEGWESKSSGEFPYLNINQLMFWVCWFQTWFMFSKDIRYTLPNFHFMFLKDMKYISKIFKKFLDGSSSSFGARLFQIWHLFEVHLCKIIFFKMFPYTF